MSDHPWDRDRRQPKRDAATVADGLCADLEQSQPEHRQSVGISRRCAPCAPYWLEDSTMVLLYVTTDGDALATLERENETSRLRSAAVIAARRDDHAAGSRGRQKHQTLTGGVRRIEQRAVHRLGLRDILLLHVARDLVAALLRGLDSDIGAVAMALDGRRRADQAEGIAAAGVGLGGQAHRREHALMPGVSRLQLDTLVCGPEIEKRATHPASAGRF